MHQLLVRAIVASLIIGTSIYWAVDAAHHHGPGVTIVGGDEPGTGGAITTDERSISLSEVAYRRREYAYSGMTLFIGVMMLGSLPLTCRKRREWKIKT